MIHCREILERTNLPLSKFVIDIGASDGVALSPVFHLFNNGWKGKAIEPDRQKVRQFKKNLPNIPIHHGFAFPETLSLVIGDIPSNLTSPFRTVIHISPQYGVELQSIDVIKIDIDSFDYWIAKEAIKYRPKLMVVEINRTTVPPIRLTIKYDPKMLELDKTYSGCCLSSCLNLRPIIGCSIQILNDLMTSNGYKLIQLDWVDAYYVRNDIKLKRVNVVKAFYKGFLNSISKYYDIRLGKGCGKCKCREVMELPPKEKLEYYQDRTKDVSDKRFLADHFIDPQIGDQCQI